MAILLLPPVYRLINPIFISYSNKGFQSEYRMFKISWLPHELINGNNYHSQNLYLNSH